jgi:2-polyprenyl-3-methyl-5-hydroxy-6-metoxy-1,4-benzoquinol methylase
MTDDAIFDLALEALKDSWATSPILDRVADASYDRQLGTSICSLMFSKCERDETQYRKALADFALLSEEFVMLQIQLDRTGHYLYSSYDEVREKVYDNPDLMAHQYLNGLFLSGAFWVNHTKMFKYFIERFCAPASSTGSVLEVPSGTGLFISEFVKRNPAWRALGIDISESSISFGREVARIHGSPSVEFRKEDVYDLPDSVKYDRIICGELLEHLEDPVSLLRKLRNLIESDGRIFLTTAIWAASVDHIYLYESTQQARDMLEEFFTIESELVLNVRSEKGPEDPKTPINYACVLIPA